MNDEQRKGAYLEMVLGWYEERNELVECQLKREVHFTKTHAHVPLPLHLEGLFVGRAEDGTVIYTNSSKRLDELLAKHKEGEPWCTMVWITDCYIKTPCGKAVLLLGVRDG